MLGEPGLGRGAVSGRRGVGAVGAGGSAPGGMFRKARRVNVRKRNDSEEEDEERDEEAPHDPPAPAGEGTAEASAVAALAASCVGHNPSLRPSMADVVRTLEQSAQGSILAVGKGSDGRKKL